MKTRTGLILMAAVSLLVLAPGGPSLNARFIDWQNRQNVIHILVHDDDGRSFVGPAVVDAGKWLLFGYELEADNPGDTVKDLQDQFINNPLHDLTLSIDGAPAFSVKSFYQDAFEATPSSGPRWSWDHTKDGIGNGGGSGYADWEGPTIFFRYLHPGVSAGAHTFEFTYVDPSGDISDTITVEAVP